MRYEPEISELVESTLIKQTLKADNIYNRYTSVKHENWSEYFFRIKLTILTVTTKITRTKLYVFQNCCQVLKSLLLNQTYARVQSSRRSEGIFGKFFVKGTRSIVFCMTQY